MMAQQHHNRHKQMADVHCPCPEVQLGHHATRLITLADNTAQHINAETAQVSWVYTHKVCWCLAAHDTFTGLVIVIKLSE